MALVPGTQEVISIHAPREGGDDWIVEEIKKLQNFNPRPPRGGRHKPLTDINRRLPISIHAPREGGDSNANLMGNPIFLISIHAPREGGDSVSYCAGYRHCISIHAPREGGDACSAKRFNADMISIHAPREGGD